MLKSNITGVQPQEKHFYGKISVYTPEASFDVPQSGTPALRFGRLSSLFCS
ncbi:MAG: hypothetical protein K2J01_05975 [Clostridiales bacterium]|nr:hypothetical protein [Clostridiales bacterium]